jgi:Family of unknown function (DUF5675)
MPITKKGWEILIKRIRQERRKGQKFPRTISNYEVFHDGVKVDGLAGSFVERQGPGDNSKSGRTKHLRIAAGRYRLATHSGAKDLHKKKVKYQTIGYSKLSDIGQLPRPAIRFLDTENRAGILIHPGNGYIWSIGCFNPGQSLRTAKDNLRFLESRPMVIALIDDIRAYLGNKFPKNNNKDIPDALAIVEGEPA